MKNSRTLIFAKRNLRLYFRDKASVFFSCLAVIIIIGLYVMFLGDMITADFKDVNGGRFLSDSWITAGLVTVASLSTTMGAFGIMVGDKANKIYKDFMTSPLKRREITAGYIVSSVTVGVIMSIAAFILAEIYIVSNGGSVIGLYDAAALLGAIILSVFSNCSMVLFLMVFIKSQNAFGAASSIIGSMSGFLAGVYIPIGALPETMKYLLRVFPVSHAAALTRKIIMRAPIEQAFLGADAQTVSSFKADMGVTLGFGSYTFPWWIHVAALVFTTALFYILSSLHVSKKDK